VLSIALVRFKYICFSVTTPELERIQEAYKRACGFAGIMKETVFIRDVLGDNVPAKLGQVCMGGWFKKYIS